MKKDYVKKICICAMLAALFVSLELIASNFGKIAFLDNYQIPISCFPLIIASFMFGIGWGTATAVVGSFLSQLSLGYGIGWSTFLWMVPTIVYALTVAILYKVFKSNKNYVIAIELFISSVVLSVLNIGASYVSNWITGGDVVAKLLAIFATLKFVGGIIFAVIFAIVIPPIVKRIKKVIKI